MSDREPTLDEMIEWAELRSRVTFLPETLGAVDDERAMVGAVRDALMSHRVMLGKLAEVRVAARDDDEEGT